MTTDTYHLRKARQVMARGVRPHYVYFMVAEPHDARHPVVVKIGTAVDVDERLTQVRAGSAKSPAWLEDRSAARRIDLAGWVVGDRELERHLHRAFAPYCEGGEWFALTPIRDDINNLLAADCVCRGCQTNGGTSAHL